MKKLLIGIALFAFAGLASAQVIGGVIGGYGQVVGASSESSVGFGGGSGAALIGIAGSTTTVGSSNISASTATQSLGTSQVISESLSGGGITTTSGALGLAGAQSGGGGSAGGDAGGIAGQGAIGGLGFIFP